MNPAQRPMITIDVEDWAQSTWDSRLPITQHAARNTQHVLKLLERLGIRATFFILGLFSETFPKLVKEIQASGHELASHGHGHIPLTAQTPAQFREDVRRAKGELEALLGQPVLGYRAPDFSILHQAKQSTLWALEILAQEGFTWDSSIFPILSKRYGVEHWPLTPLELKLPSGLRLKELPIATLDPLGSDRPPSLRRLEGWLRAREGQVLASPERSRRWPIGGGGYFRLLPGLISRTLAARVLQDRPYVFYCHPYEFAPHELKTLEVPLSVRLHQGLGRGPFEARFCAFVQALGGQSVAEFLAHHRLETVPLTSLQVPFLRQPPEVRTGMHT